MRGRALELARAKCEQLERELRRSPDFQLYLLTEPGHDRARMESVLMEIPQFALWIALRRSVEFARSELIGSPGLRLSQDGLAITE